MFVALRTILIWLLALALPAQGMAAATLSLCSPSRHATVAVAVTAAQHGTRAGPAHHAGQHAHPHPAQADSGHAHPDHRPLADKQPAGAGDGVSAAAAEVVKLVHADKHQCSACASCCSAAVIPSSVLSVAEPAVAPTVFVAVVPTVEKFAASGPDRPPRVFLV